MNLALLDRSVLSDNELERIPVEVAKGATPFECAVDLYTAYQHNQEPELEFEPGFLFVRSGDGGESQASQVLRQAHDLASLAVFASRKFESTVSSLRDLLVEHIGIEEHDADAGIVLCVDRETLRLGRGGRLLHPNFRKKP